MICCSDPTCAEDAGLTLKRQIDIEPLAFCLPHGYQREAELKQRLENYQMVTLGRPPSELELALARVAELESAEPNPFADAGDGDGPELADQLETALHTLELQSKTLDTARTELADREASVTSLRKELERSRGELETVKREAVADRDNVLTQLNKARDDLALCRLELERFQAEAATGQRVEGVGPITPPPPTRPDRK